MLSIFLWAYHPFVYFFTFFVHFKVGFVFSLLSCKGTLHIRAIKSLSDVSYHLVDYLLIFITMYIDT